MTTEVLINEITAVLASILLLVALYGLKMARTYLMAKLDLNKLDGMLKKIVIAKEQVKTFVRYLEQTNVNGVGGEELKELALAALPSIIRKSGLIIDFDTLDNLIEEAVHDMNIERDKSFPKVNIEGVEIKPFPAPEIGS